MSVISIKKLIIGLIIFGVVSKLIIMIVSQSWDIKNDFHFSWEAGEIGASLAMGKGYSWIHEMEHHNSKPGEPTAWEAPVYPFIIAGVFKVFGIYSKSSAIAMLFFQIIISTMSCILIFLIGRHIYNDWVGFLAALLLTIYPVAIHYASQKIYLTALYVFLLLLFIFQILKLAESRSAKNSFLTGVTGGLTLLCSPSFISFLPFSLAWLFFKLKCDLKLRTVLIALMVLGICVSISPWQIRNYIVFDKFILVRSNLSRELLLGNYGGRSLEDSDRERIKASYEGKRSEIYMQVFKKSIINNPERFMLKVWQRAKRFWTVTPRVNGPNGIKTGSLSERILGVFYILLLVSGLLGLCFSVFKNIGAQLLSLLLISLPLPYYLTWFTRFRYRFPVEVILIIFSSFLLWYLWSRLRERWVKT